MGSKNAVDLEEVNLYDELKETEEGLSESEKASVAAKNLSLRLFETRTPEEVMRIFDKEYLRQMKKDIYGEELVLILKFLESNMKNGMSRPEAVKFLTEDKRVDLLIEFIMSRIPELDPEYKIVTTYTLGVFLSAYEYELSKEEYYEQVIRNLKDIDFPESSLPDIPAMIFVLPSFLTDET